MTNEEKARDIALCGKPYFSNDYEHGMFDGAKEMAEWKDKQSISILPEIFDYFENVIGLYDGGLDHSDVDKPKFLEYFSKIITK